jgi:RecA/RadA recombinase
MVPSKGAAKAPPKSPRKKKTSKPKVEVKTSLPKVVPLGDEITTPSGVSPLPPTLGQIQGGDRNWLWTGYIPRGVVTVVTGPQGIGKTAFLAHAAYLETWGDRGGGIMAAPQHAVLWHSAEDDPRTMLHPRLGAAGVQLSMVHLPDYDGAGRLKRRTCIPTDTQAVGDLAFRCGAKLVVFDPLTSFLAPGVSPNDPLQVRIIMDALSIMAAEHDLAVLCALHPRKGRSGTPLEWVSGSAAWTQAARQVILLDRHPDRRGEYMLAVIKPCSSKPAPPWRYVLDMAKGSPRIDLLDECEFDPQELSELGDLGECEERTDALEWMKGELVEEKEVRAMYRRWTEQGYGRSLWWRCRRKLGVKVTRRGTQTDQQTYLYIPPPTT